MSKAKIRIVRPETLEELTDAIISQGEAKLRTLTPEQIVSFLEKASDAYYNDQPFLTDAQFDSIFDYLKKVDPQNPFLKQTRAPVTGANPYASQLPFYVGSLDKIRDDEPAILRWRRKYPGPVIIEPKLDGITGVYGVNGNRVELYTGGDGFTGNDITRFLPYLQHTLPKLPGGKDTYFYVRGEFIIPKKDWLDIAHLGKNARNTVSGALNTRKKFSKEVLERVHFVVYELLTPRLPLIGPENSFEILERLGFEVVKHDLADASQLSEDFLLAKLFEELESYPYEIDGLVVTSANQIYPLPKDGNPEYAFAYKSLETHKKAEVVVREVIWNVGKDNFLSPVVLFDPIELSGITVSRATGINAKFIEENRIGPGARIVIIRSGDVIPRIINVLSPGRNGFPPEGSWEWDENHVFIRATEESDDHILKIMEHFTSQLDIEGVKAGVLRKLYDSGIDSLVKLIKIRPEQLQNIPGIGKSIAEKIYSGISKIRRGVPCSKMMAASNVFGRTMGAKKLKMITELFPPGGIPPSFEELVAIPSIGDATAQFYLDGYNDFLDFLKETGIECSSETVSGGDLAGMTFVFTGFRNKELEEAIVLRGGKVSTSVSGNTSAVIAKSLSEGGAKLLKARSLNIPILTLDQFVSEYQF